MADKWYRVMEALAKLYEIHSKQESLADVLQALEQLMRAYDDWLD